MKMLQEYWASTVIFIGIFSQCTMIFNTASTMTNLSLNSQNRLFFMFRNWAAHRVSCFSSHKNKVAFESLTLTRKVL